MIHRIEVPTLFCPGCGTSQRAEKDYPWHFCNGCLARATDHAGRRLEFASLGLTGIGWRYADDQKWREHRAAICLINRRRVFVSEARLGGIIAQPLPTGPLDLDGVDDLSRQAERQTLPDGIEAVGIT